MSVKLILDTDIGTDIDDAICLTYLLNNPECDLLGITTVTGEPEKRAMIASSICKHAGKEVPIYPGHANPVRIQQHQKLAIQAKSLDKWPHQKEFPKGEAVEFLRKTIRANPGEITLLTIGPLTNIGVLFTLDPEIPAMLKSLVMMCGYYQFKFRGKGKQEWNARGDFHSSQVVFNQSIKDVKAIGLDVTQRVKLTSDEFKERFHLDAFLPLQDYAAHWYQEFHPTVTFHDPLAGTVVFKPEICKYKQGNISVLDKGRKKKGKTIFVPDKNGKHLIAETVNKDKFFKEYFSVFK